MIDIPYIIAELFPPPFFRKKLTVIGMIGHTQGVSRAMSPPRKPRRKRDQRPESPFPATPNPVPSPVMGKGAGRRQVDSVRVETPQPPKGESSN
jgi:hypothetical protein